MSALPLSRRNFPDDAEIVRIASPEFDAAPPRLIGGELIPPQALAAMDAVWSISRFEQREIRILRLCDVWVVKQGLVFDASGALFEETITQHSPDDIEWAHSMVLTAMDGSFPTDDGGPVLLCKKCGVGNYGHWLIEMLSKAHLVRSRMPELKPRVLVARTEGQLAETMRLSLDRLGIGADETIAADDGPRHFAELLVVDGLSVHGVYMSPLALECVDAVSRGIEPAAYPKLLVLRRSAGCRMLTDEDAIIQLALEHDYAVIDSGLMPLHDQIALFKGAERIVGIMGAAMTNIAFARPGTAVVTLAPAGMADTFFWFLATLRGLDYTEVRCPQSGPVRGNSPWDTDFTLDPALYGRVFRGD